MTSLQEDWKPWHLSRPIYWQYRAIEEQGRQMLDKVRLAEKGWTCHVWHDMEQGLYGLCNYRRKRILISQDFIARTTPRQVHLMLIHEVAHALTPRERGHGPKWRAYVHALGGDPDFMPNPYRKWEVLKDGLLQVWQIVRNNISLAGLFPSKQNTKEHS